MYLFLTYVHIYHGYGKYDCEQYQRRCTCTALVGVDVVVNEADHRVEASCRARGAHRFAEYTYDTGIFLEAADEARYYYVCDHR